jgi:DNA-binding transcriptional ArsR family regulator
MLNRESRVARSAAQPWTPRSAAPNSFIALTTPNNDENRPRVRRCSPGCGKKSEFGAIFPVDIDHSVRANLPLVDTYLQAGLDALGDATRMAIFQKLSAGPIAVNELARTLPVSRPAVSQHLKVLKDAGLVLDTKAGTRRLYQLDPAGVARLRAHFDHMWTKALSAFQMAAEESPTQKPSTGDKHGKDNRRSRRS